MSLTGTSMGVVINNTSSGKVTSLSSPTENASVFNSGSGTCRIYVINSLSVKISGSGNVYYQGNPIDFTKEITGSGKLIKL